MANARRLTEGYLPGSYRTSWISIKSLLRGTQQRTTSAKEVLMSERTGS